MATSTLLNYLETGSSNEVMNRRQVETFIAGEAIAAKDFVALDFSQSSDADKALYVMKAGTVDTATTMCVGVALGAAASGAKVDVVVKGVCEANVAGDTTAGEFLIITGTDGQAGKATDNTLLPMVACACEADAANVATVIVIKQF
jgi:exoribonuclease II